MQLFAKSTADISTFGSLLRQGVNPNIYDEVWLIHLQQTFFNLVVFHCRMAFILCGGPATVVGVT